VTSPAVNHSWPPLFLEPVGRCGQFRWWISETLPSTHTHKLHCIVWHNQHFACMASYDDRL